MSPSEPSPHVAKPNRRRLWIFRLVTLLLIPALFFAIAEGTLRLMGVGYATSFVVPVVEKPGYLADNYKFAWRFFPKALARAPQPIMVLKEKPVKTKRIVVFGGSAAMGDPEPAYGLPRVLERLLAARFRDYDFEVVNAAVTAINSHVVLPICEDCRKLDADAWVIYMGNNEVHGPFGAGTVFGGGNRPRWLNRSGLALQRTRIGQLAFRLGNGRSESAAPENWGGMEMFHDQQISHDHPGLQSVYTNFRRNLEDFLRVAARVDTPVILSTTITNLKDSAPFVSLHSPSLSDLGRQQWTSAFDAGCQAQTNGDYKKAITAFEQAAAIDQHFAELEYRMGECFLRLGEFAQAKQQFERARDHDGLRFRADSTMNNIVREVSQNNDNASVVDGEQSLAAQVPDGILGNEFLYEHVHFNFAGNYQLGLLLAKRIAERLGIWGENGAADSDWPSQQACADALGLTPYHELLTLKDIRGRLNAPPFTGQINHAERDRRLAEEEQRLSKSISPDLAEISSQHFHALIQARPTDWLLRRQFALLLDSLGDLAGATEQYEEIAQQLPHHAESFFRLGALYNRTKQWKEAENALRRALTLRPEFARAANSLGICLSHQQRFDESYLEFQRAVELQPTFAEAFLNWGLVHANQGEDVAAVERYQQAVDADADYLPARIRLGKIFVTAQDYASALPHYQAVARLKPQEANAHLNLGMLLAKVGDMPNAKIHFEKTLEIDPHNRVAQQSLDQLRQIQP